MSLEQLKSLFVDLPQFVFFEFEPDTKVNHRMEVETNNYRVVPGSRESLFIPVDQVLEVGRPDGRPSAHILAEGLHRFFSLRASLPAGGNYLKYFSGLDHPRGFDNLVNLSADVCRNPVGAFDLVTDLLAEIVEPSLWRDVSGLTGALPYGEKIEDANSMRAFEGLEYVPSQQRNPMVPVWMDAALRTAVEIPWRRRYGVMSELLYDLRHPNRAFLKEKPRPLIERDPLRFWKGLAVLLGLAWAATLWFWLAS